MEADVSLTSYRIFNTVAKTGNLSKAASELNVSQPAISKAVQRLEKSLAVKLLVRKSRGVSLTEEGSLLYTYTCSAFETLQRGETSLRAVNQTLKAPFRIGVNELLCKNLLLPVIKEFLDSTSEPSPFVEFLSSPEVKDQLQKQSISLALGFLTGAEKNVTFFPVQTVSFVFAASAAYLKKKKSTDPVLVPEAISEEAFFQKFMQRNSTRLSFQFVETADMLFEFTKLGMGTGLFIKEFITEELANGILYELPFEDFIESQTAGFSCLTKSSSEPAFNRFLAFLLRNE